MQNFPYKINETQGKKAYCACDKSSKLPYCDGSHKGSGKSPFVVEIKADGVVAVCGCGKSNTRPFCDGSHKTA